VLKTSPPENILAPLFLLRHRDIVKHKNTEFNRKELIYDIRKLASNHPEGASKISAALY